MRPRSYAAATVESSSDNHRPSSELHHSDSNWRSTTGRRALRLVDEEIDRRLAIEPIRFYRIVTAGCQTQKPDVVKMTQKGTTCNRHNYASLDDLRRPPNCSSEGRVYGNARTSTDPKNHSVG